MFNSLSSDSMASDSMASDSMASDSMASGSRPANSFRPKSLSVRFRNVALTLLGLGLGFLTLCVSTQLLYAIYLSGEGHRITSQFLAFSAMCGVVFSALGGYVAAFFARRRPVAHAALFCLMMTVLYVGPSVLFGLQDPAFFAVLNVAIAVTGAMIGGWFRYWQVCRHLSV